MKLNIPQIKLNKREAIIAGCLGALLFVFILDKVFLSGMRERLSELNTRIKNEESRLLEGAKIEHKKGQISDEHERYKIFLDIMKEPGKEILTRFLKEAETIVKAAGGSVVSFSPRTDPEIKKDHVKYLADLQIEIDPQQLFKFFFNIEESKLLIKLDSFSLSPKNEQANILKLDSVLSMSVYSE